MGSAPKILGVGSPLLDILTNIDDPFLLEINGDKGGMELVSEKEQTQILAKLIKGEVKKSPGGSAANTMIGLLKLGLDSSFLGKLGHDEDGEFFINQFKKLGGGHERFKFCKSNGTGKCLSLITPDTERTMRTYLGAAASLDISDITADDFENYTHVHMEGYMLFNQDLAIHLLEFAKQSGCTVSLDLASFEVVNANKKTLPNLLNQYVDMVFANEEEAEAFSNSKDPVYALDQLSEFCSTVAVKLGPKGVHVKHQGDKTFTEAVKVRAVDSTGAGDLWASGFLYGILIGKSTSESAQFGSIIGSEVVQEIGAVISDEKWQDILEKIK